MPASEDKCFIEDISGVGEEEARGADTLVFLLDVFLVTVVSAILIMKVAE